MQRARMDAEVFSFRIAPVKNILTGSHSWNVNLNKATYINSSDRRFNLMRDVLYSRPTCSAQNNYAYTSITKILLVLQIFVCCEQNVEALILSFC